MCQWESSRERQISLHLLHCFSYACPSVCLPKWVKNKKHFDMPLKIVRVPQKKFSLAITFIFAPEHFIQMRNHLYLIPEHFFSARKFILLPQTFNSVRGI